MQFTTKHTKQKNKGKTEKQKEKNKKQKKRTIFVKQCLPMTDPITVPVPGKTAVPNAPPTAAPPLPPTTAVLFTVVFFINRAPHSLIFILPVAV